jgi:hypothetical protein
VGRAHHLVVLVESRGATDRWERELSTLDCRIVRVVVEEALANPDSLTAVSVIVLSPSVLDRVDNIPQLVHRLRASTQVVAVLPPARLLLAGYLIDEGVPIVTEGGPALSQIVRRLLRLPRA